MTDWSLLEEVPTTAAADILVEVKLTLDCRCLRLDAYLDQYSLFNRDPNAAGAVARHNNHAITEVCPKMA